MLHQEITSAIIGGFYEVYNTLGFGFLEKVYENALIHVLRKQGLHVRQQMPLKVYFNKIIVGEYFADLLVEDKVILELKAAQQITEAHKAQLLNYLKATDIEVGLVLNFGPKATFKRQIFTQKAKK